MNGHDNVTTKTNGSHSSNGTVVKDDNATGTAVDAKEKETTYEILQRWYKLLFTKEDYLHHHKDRKSVV